MRTLYVIRDKISGAYCYSAKHTQFDDSFDIASMFDEKENAEKAMKEMNKWHRPTWYLNNQHVSIESDSPVYPMVLAEFEVVPCTLTTQGNVRDLYRDENFSLENLNDGHYPEAMDRLHMLQEQLHSALWNHGALSEQESEKIQQASELLMEVYQSVGHKALV